MGLNAAGLPSGGPPFFFFFFFPGDLGFLPGEASPVPLAPPAPPSLFLQGQRKACWWEQQRAACGEKTRDTGGQGGGVERRWGEREGR